MRVLVVSGIWPPDVGGPASHAPEVADFLRARGHVVEVVTTADARPPARAYAVRWTPRSLPVGARHLHGAALVARRARRADVVYSTGLYTRSAVGAAIARRPLVVKLTADPAYERSVIKRLHPDSFDDFQRAAGGVRIGALRLLRDVGVRRAAHVVTPSRWLAEVVAGWGVPEHRISVLPNPTPVPPRPADPGDVLRRHGANGGGRTLAFAGRLTAQKALDVGLEAVARTEGVTLLVAGDGPERERLEQRARELRLGERVRFLGAQPRAEVLALFAAADATLLSSAWENFPHGVVESLAVGTPVLATRAGGVAEIVEHERNGLLVEPGDAAGLARSIERYFADDELREQLRGAATESVSRFAPDHIHGQLESILTAAASR